LGKNMNNKICLVTGATSGVGKATVLGLAEAGLHIVMLSRDRQRGDRVRSEIIQKTHHPHIDLLTADLSDQNSIRLFASEFKNTYNRLDVLSNNAGILLPRRELTEDGIEKVWAVNYLSCYLLTGLLMDVLVKSGSGRILNVVGSPGMMRHIKMHFDDIQLEEKYNGFKAIGQSVLARLLFTYELSRRIENYPVTVNAFHPGLIRSDLQRNMPGPVRWMASLVQFLLSVRCRTSEYLALSEDISKVSGCYFVNRKAVSFHSKHIDRKTGSELWSISESLTGFKYPL